MREVVRTEKKYLMDFPASERLKGRLQKLMKEDSHNGPKGYMVRSLYFDTMHDTDYWEKYIGIELRRKIRLRIYDPLGDKAWLEIKQKQGSYQRKRSLELTKDDAQRLIATDYSVLLEQNSELAAELYAFMQTRFYRPVVVVDYNRTAFIGKENDTRVTLDRLVSVSKSSFDIFDPGLLTLPVMKPGKTILEIKYNGFMVSYLKNFLNTVDESELSVSKYIMARAKI